MRRELETANSIGMTDRESRDTIPDLSMAQAVDAEKAYMVREAEDAYQVLSVQGMLKLSEQNAIALRCSQSAALRHLVFDAERELTRARARLLRNAAEAAHEIATAELSDS